MPRHCKISARDAKRLKPYHKGILFIEAVPEDTKTAFKAACYRRGTTMRDVIIELMRGYVHETAHL
jgi:hypothetical protein